MKSTDFNLTNTNAELRRAVQDQNVNYCQMLSMPFEARLSVIAREDEALSQRFVTLNERLETVPVTARERVYFGASPLLDNKLILEALARLQFSTREGLDGFIREHHDQFAVTEPFSPYLLSLSRYIVVAYASNFCVTICPDTASLPAFSEFAKQYPQIVAIETKKDNKELKVPRFTIKGCPLQSMMPFLSQYRYLHGGESGLFVLNENGMEISELYAQPGNQVLKDGAVFYSGVLPKVTRIEILDNVYENYKTNAISLYYVESTFATVFALDRNFTEHPLLEADRPCMVSLLKADDREKMQMIRALDDLLHSEAQTPARVIEQVNAYLAASVNVNQIGVSANLTTGDGILLLGKRNAKTNSYDKHCLYPGVNGNAEFADDKVSFYQYSAHEDIPTMNRGAVRNDFLGEITRETSAELAIFYDNNIFSCVGVSICGNIPKDEDVDETHTERYEASSRRCHLNILYDAKIKENFLDVEKASKDANEAFENERMCGLRVTCYQSPFSVLTAVLTACADFLSTHKDVLESILMIILAFTTYFSLQGSSEGSFSSTLSLVLAVAVLISTLHKLYRWTDSVLLTKKHCRSLFIFRGSSPATLRKKIRKAFKGYSYHPVAYAIANLYVEKKVYGEFFDQGRRGKTH